MEKKSKKAAVIVGIATAFITSFSGSALNLSIPQMSDYFHMSASGAGWIVTSYMLIVAGFSAPVGKLADTTGRRRILLIGIGVFGITSLSSIFAVSKEMIITFRALQGIGASMIFATNMPIAMEAFSPNERGKVIGKVIAGTYAGLTLGPVIGGILNNSFGWQAIFAFSAIVAASSFCIAVKLIPAEKTRKNDEGIDLKGNIIYILMLSCIIYGLTAFNSFAYAKVILFAGLIFVVLFALIELKTQNPMIDVRIFSNDINYTLSNLTALFNYSATFGIGYLLSIYLQVVEGLSSHTAGIILIAQPFFMAVLTPKIGSLSDKVPAYKLASAGMALCAISLGIFSVFPSGVNLIVIIISLSIAGIGTALFSSPNTNVVMSCVSRSQFGLANSILTAMRNTGHSAGMAIVTIVVSATAGNASLYELSTEELMRTMHISFTVFTILCFAGIFMSVSRRKTGQYV